MMAYGMGFGETYVGWVAGGSFHHVLIKKDRTHRLACGAKVGEVSAASATKLGPGCAKCMAWAKKHGVRA